MDVAFLDHFFETATGDFKIPCKLNMTLLALAVLVQSHEVALDCWSSIHSRRTYDDSMCSSGKPHS